VLSGGHGPAQTFFHPDYTVGPGVSPGHGGEKQWQVTSDRQTLAHHLSLGIVTALIPLAGFTADRELELQPSSEAANPHPAPKV